MSENDIKNKLIIELKYLEGAIVNANDEKKRVLKECVGDKVKEIIKALEEASNNTGRTKDTFGKKFEEDAELALKDFIGKKIKCNYKKYYYKVLPYAEYFDSKIPWFSEKWDRLRYDFQGLKAIAEVAYNIFYPSTSGETAPGEPAPGDQHLENQHPKKAAKNNKHNKNKH